MHYRLLPNHVKQQARNAYILFLDPQSLNFKRRAKTPGLLSARQCRLPRSRRDGVNWFWIGHQEYDRLLDAVSSRHLQTSTIIASR